MSLLDPRTIIETVRPAFAIPVIFTTFEDPASHKNKAHKVETVVLLTNHLLYEQCYF